MIYNQEHLKMENPCFEISYFTLSYVSVAGISSLCIITAIDSAEGLIIFVLDVYNDFQNTILPNPAEIVYLSLPYLYLDWYKIKWP